MQHLPAVILLLRGHHHIAHLAHVACALMHQSLAVTTICCMCCCIAQTETHHGSFAACSQILIGGIGCLQGAGEDHVDISQEGVSTSTSSDAESPSLPPLSVSQQALVGASLLAYGGLFAATATVMLGAAAVKMLLRPTIPRPRIPSFSLW